MPRNGSGVYTLPAGNPVVTGTPIASTWANGTMNDIAQQLNEVVTRDGLLGPTAPFKLINGTLALPALTFASSPNTGLFSNGNDIGFSFNGILRMIVGEAGGPAGVYVDTPAPGDNSQLIATTAWVNTAIGAVGGIPSLASVTNVGNISNVAIKINRVGTAYIDNSSSNALDLNGVTQVVPGVSGGMFPIDATKFLGGLSNRWQGVISSTLNVSGNFTWGASSISAPPGTATLYLNGAGQWTTPAGGGGGSQTLQQTVTLGNSTTLPIVFKSQGASATAFVTGGVNIEDLNLNGVAIASAAAGVEGLYPAVTNAYDLGATSLRWSGLAIQTADISGNIKWGAPTITPPPGTASTFLSGAGTWISPGAASVPQPNRILNGAMLVDQQNKGAAIPLTAGAIRYTFDQMLAYYIGTGTASVQQAQTTIIPGIARATEHRMTFAGGGAKTEAGIETAIEAANSYDLAGLQVTFSAWVYQSTGAIRNLSLLSAKCTANNTFVGATALSNTFTVSPATIPNDTWTFVTVNGPLDADAINGLGIGLKISGGAAWATGAFAVTFMKLEPGTIATAFQRPDLGSEVNSLQRYYEEIGSDVAGAFTWSFAMGANSQIGRVPISFKAAKMRIPTVSITGAGMTITNGTGTPSFPAIGRGVCHMQQTGTVVNAMVTVASTLASFIAVDGRMPLV